MAIKLVAVDIDDTLITDELIIPERVKEAVAKARAQGVKVVLATGRMLSSTIPFARELGLKEPVICYNGALIQSVDDEQPLIHHPIPWIWRGDCGSRSEGRPPCQCISR